MFDFYGLAFDWPGRREASMKKNYVKKVRHLESATLAAICKSSTVERTDERFVPYFAMYEFEALLFSDPEKLARSLGVDFTHIQKICHDFNNPEEINDDPLKAPSKRIIQLVPNYRKIVDGNAIINDIGLQQIRQECQHFNEWLTRLENLSQIR